MTTNATIAAGRQEDVGRLMTALELIEERLAETLGALIAYQGRESHGWHENLREAAGYAEGLAGALNDMHDASQ